MPRADLPRRLRMGAKVVVPCLVVPDGRAHWVHVLPLSHTIYVRHDEALHRRVGDEVVRAAAALSLTAEEYLRVLPTPSHQVVPLTIEIERDDASDASKRASTRRRDQTEKKDKAAHALLAKIGTVLLAAAKDRKGIPPVLGRDREIQTLGSLLSGRERLGVVLVGEPLSGKTSIVHGLLAGKSKPFGNRTVVATSGAQLVAGQSGFGQLQERVDAVMEAVERTDSILYFDDYGDLFAGHSGSIEDLAAMMRPWLADGRVRIVGELSPEVLEHHEKRHVAFFAAMHRITVASVDAAATRAILDARIVHQARTEPHRPQIAAACVEPLVELCARYLTYQAFPGKAVALADELRAVHEGEVSEDGSPRMIEVSDVYRAFCVRSGIPMFLLRDTHAMRYTEVLEYFARAVIGQRPAIEAVAQALCTVKAGLQPPSKPLANLLFVGPTGVGKTEVAKTLARYLFGGTDKLVRFDMSEYADAYASERLIRGTERDEGEVSEDGSPRMIEVSDVYRAF
ncbi:MAG: ATP-dependent Clp protease ATP-binding subunit, partial [Nannocystaceae bacterium]|nr:ATP-dependent Clp protease ATP-binding subunit [Nannocystaceae bacterium]